MTSRDCLSQADIDRRDRTLPRPDGECKLVDIVTRGNRTTYDMTCTLETLHHARPHGARHDRRGYDGMSELRVRQVGGREGTRPATVVVNAKRDRRLREIAGQSPVGIAGSA